MYMSPETFNRNYGAESDVWSLGIMLYQLYALRFPFWCVPYCTVQHRTGGRGAGERAGAPRGALGRVLAARLGGGRRAARAEGEALAGGA